MPRGVRIEYPGAFYHVMARGNRCQAIFLGDEDRRFFLKTLGEACEKTGWAVHAWVLMGNHYHLLIETPEANLVEGMKWLQNAYTRRFNVKHSQWGRLFGDRYKAVLVEGEKPDYFVTLLDYIHLNPVRSGLVKVQEGQSLLDYPWSSLVASYARSGKRPLAWSSVERGFASLDLCDSTAGRREFVERLDRRALNEAERAGVVEISAGMDARFSHLRRGWYWGSQGFAEACLKLVKGKIRAAKSPTMRTAPVSQMHDTVAAASLVERALAELELEPGELEGLPGADPRKVAIADLVAGRTAVSQKWIAERLAMGSPGNVSQQLGRFRAERAPRSREFGKLRRRLSRMFD